MRTGPNLAHRLINLLFTECSYDPSRRIARGGRNRDGYTERRIKRPALRWKPGGRLSPNFVAH